MKKRVTAMIMAAFMLLAMAGCGGGKADSAVSSDAGKSGAESKAESSQSAQLEEDSEKPEASEAGTDSGEAAMLRFSWWGGDERLEATLAVIDQFHELHPNVSIEAEYGSSDGYADKLATQLAAGTEPDIMQLDPAYMSQFTMGDTDYFVDMLEAGFDFSAFDENYLSMQANGRYGDRQLGIPTGVACPALLINQDLLGELKDVADIDFTKPYSWDDLMEWGRKVHEYDENLYLFGDNKDMIQALLVTAITRQVSGGPTMDDETGEQLLTVEEWTTVYEIVKALYDNNVVPPTSYLAAYSGDAMQTDPNWIEGRYVADFVHNSLIEIMIDANPDANYTAGNLPTMPDTDMDGWLSNGPQVMAISKRSAYIDDALSFLDYFFNDDTALETLGGVRSAPPTQHGRELCEEKGLLNPVVAESIEVINQYKSVELDKLSGSTEVTQIIRDQVEAIGFGTVTPEKAAEETMSLFENYLSSLNLG